MRAAARRTEGAISSGRWYQLESGYQKVGGQSLPIGTTASTVAAAARAVDWDVSEALTVAGFDNRDYQDQPTNPITRYSDDDLLAEIRRRIKGARSGVASETQSDAQASGDQSKEVTLFRARPQPRPPAEITDPDNLPEGVAAMNKPEDGDDNGHGDDIPTDH